MDIRNKSISVRVSERDLEALDKLHRELTYYSRSDLINAAIKFIAHPLAKTYVRKLSQLNPERGRRLEMIDLDFNY